ncbi:muconate cycloisomerase 1-like, partial [Teratosphaeria destructans]
KHISPRPHDGPRHTWPHPTARILYSLQEHTSMVDLFAIDPTDGTTLHHLTGVKIIPADQDPKDYWADEVRLSPGPHPRHLYASTRGLTAATRGYVAVFALDPADGTLASDTALHIWQTPTSGGIANAIEPAPRADDDTGVEYLAMTDSEEGWVFMLGFDPRKGEIGEVARVNLGKTGEGEVVKAATAVWL